MKKESKAYPYLKALLDGLIEAAPNWAKAPAKFVSSSSEQLKDKGKEENKQLEEEIKSISEEELRKLIKEAGYKQKEDIELIVGKVKSIPELIAGLEKEKAWEQDEFETGEGFREAFIKFLREKRVILRTLLNFYLKTHLILLSMI